MDRVERAQLDRKLRSVVQQSIIDSRELECREPSTSRLDPLLPVRPEGANRLGAKKRAGGPLRPLLEPTQESSGLGLLNDRLDEG